MKMNMLFKTWRGKTLLLLMLFTLMSGSAWAYDFKTRWGQEIDGTTYFYDMWYNILPNVDHQVEVTFEDVNYNSYKESTRIAIPETVTHPTTGEVYTVTAIGANAFRDCTILQYIYLSNTVSIGDNAFQGCTGLVNLTFTSVLQTIGNNAFQDCTGIPFVTFPPQLTSIGQCAFKGCTNLASVNYSATNCTMSSYIFQDCTHECTLTIDYNVPGIPASAFYDFPGLKTINFGSHADFSIGESAFHACTGLTSITIPDNVTSIGRFAFDGCTGLTEVTIGTGVTSIGDSWGQTFNNCNNISTINYNATNCPDLNINNSLWIGCNHACTVHIGDNVTRLPKNIFKGLTNLNTIVYGSNPSLTEIGENAFENTGLTSVTIPNTVTTIGSSAFSGCSALASLDLGYVKSIGTSAFYNCASLTSLTIPASVTLIDAASWGGNGAFRSCTGLTEIWFMGETAPTITHQAAFEGVESTIPVYVPKGYPTNGAYSYFNNYKPYLRFVGDNYGNNWAVASNWAGATGFTPTAVPANDEIAMIDGENDPMIPDNDDEFVQVYKIILNNGRKIKIQNGGQLRTDQALLVEVEKEIDQWTTDPVGGWYFIASPINASLSPTEVTNESFSMISDNNEENGDRTYDLYSYDESNYTYESVHMPWINYRAHTTDFRIENGCGYLYASEAYKQLTFTGVTKPYSEEGGANQVALAHDGWNLIGNPFTCNVRVTHSFSELNGGSNVTAKNGGSIIKPCAGIAVYGNENDVITFGLPLEQQSQDPNQNSLNMVLTNANVRDAKPIDNVIVSFGEGNGMPKFEFGEQDAKIYFPQGNMEYAIVNSDAQGVLPLNFKANVDGDYSITVSETLSSQFSVLRLIDNLTGADVDLLATPSYQFTAKKSDYASRFKLVFHANGIEENTEDDDEFAFFSDGVIIINGEGLVQVFDVLGHQLYSHEANSAFRIPNSEFAPGVYVLRLMNGEHVRTQKIVIK